MNWVWTRLAVSLVFGLAAVGCGGDDDAGPPRVAAVVEGSEIPAADTEALVQGYLEQQAKAEEAPGDERRDQAVPFVLLYQIRHALLRHLAADLDVSIDTAVAGDAVAQLAESEPEAFQAAGVRPGDVQASSEAGRLSRAIALKLFPDVPVDEADVRAEYDNRAPLYNQGWRVQAKVASFGSGDDAARVASALAAGRTFEEAATAAGASDVGSAEMSPASPLPAPVLEAVGKLARGQVSDPLQVSTSGWAVIFAEAREELPQISFEEAKADLAVVVAEAQRQQLFAAWFDKQLKQAKITVDDFYGEWDAAHGTLQ
jgi:parvulin-like peptidyl-prolyl isomerase